MKMGARTQRRSRRCWSRTVVDEGAAQPYNHRCSRPWVGKHSESAGNNSFPTKNMQEDAISISIFASSSHHVLAGACCFIIYLQCWKLRHGVGLVDAGSLCTAGYCCVVWCVERYVTGSAGRRARGGGALHQLGSAVPSAVCAPRQHGHRLPGHAHHPLPAAVPQHAGQWADSHCSAVVSLLTFPS